MSADNAMIWHLSHVQSIIHNNILKRDEIMVQISVIKTLSAANQLVHAVLLSDANQNNNSNGEQSKVS